MLKVLKDLNDKTKIESEINGLSNILMALPHLFLQGSKDGLCRERSQLFYNIVLDPVGFRNRVSTVKFQISS